MTTSGTATKLWALDAPMLEIPASNLVHGAVGKVTIPVPAYLIEHPRGLILFDTTITPLASDDPVAVFGEATDSLRVDYPAERKLENQIHELGYRVGDVTHVVTSHAHFDHVGGLSLFPAARHYIGENEIRWAFWPDPPGKEFFSGEPFEPLRGADWTYVPQHVDHDMFGDGSVEVLSTPGHTLGELSLAVRLPNRTVILTGDTLHLRESLEHELPGPVDYNSRMAIDSIRRIARLRDERQAMLLISHDPEDWAEYGHAPKFLD
jgi:N-acyl homoserine lactone hydrolase